MAEPISKGRFWAGWILTGLIAFFFLFGAFNAFIKAPMVLEGMAPLGFSESMLIPLGVAELLCAVLFLIPRTAFFGALLFTGYLGGAVCAHARIGQPQWPVPIVFAIVIWVAYTLRSPRFEAFLKGA
jgi:hypothetical protein